MWYVVPVNPEPWAIGNLGLGKKNGKMFPKVGRNNQLDAFKQAVREELSGNEPLPPGEYKLVFYFWRRLDDYETESGRRHRKHWADATNMQKAAEDALQGVLIDNDRNVRDVRSVIVEQGADVEPRIVILAERWYSPNISDIPKHLLSETLEVPEESRNVWPPKDWL